jgi:hypothetical protein
MDIQLQQGFFVQLKTHFTAVKNSFGSLECLQLLTRSRAGLNAAFTILGKIMQLHNLLSVKYSEKAKMLNSTSH